MSGVVTDDVIVDVDVDVDVIEPVIVAVHVHGNDTVAVIVDAGGAGRAHACAETPPFARPRTHAVSAQPARNHARGHAQARARVPLDLRVLSLALKSQRSALVSATPSALTPIGHGWVDDHGHGIVPVHVHGHDHGPDHVNDHDHVSDHDRSCAP